jgi:hypothetical protein
MHHFGSLALNKNVFFIGFWEICKVLEGIKKRAHKVPENGSFNQNTLCRDK